MHQKLLLILTLVLNTSLLVAQESKSVTNDYYTRCFEKLKPLSIEKKYNSLQGENFCSLFLAIAAFEIYNKEKPLKDIFSNRIIEMSTLFYKEGHPVYLISGMDSYLNAEKKNKDIDDDNGIVYISIGECTISSSLNDAKNMFNSETLRLIEQKNN